MNRSEHPLFAHMSRDAIMFQGSVRGAATATPTITPAVYSATSLVQFMAASDNWILSTARSGVGAYTLRLKDSVPVFYDVLVSVWGTDGKQAQVADYNPTTLTLTITVLSAGAVAADLATTDNLRLTFIGNKNIPVY
jgi:hypothetical protein